MWQLRCHDHIIRNEEELNRIRKYIIDIYQSILRQSGVRLKANESEGSQTGTKVGVTAKFKAIIPLFGSGEVQTSGETVVTILPEFPWPTGTGTAYGLLWYGDLTDPMITDIYGIFGIFEFGWETN